MANASLAGRRKGGRRGELVPWACSVWPTGLGSSSHSGPREARFYFFLSFCASKRRRLDVGRGFFFGLWTAAFGLKKGKA